MEKKTAIEKHKTIDINLRSDADLTSLDQKLVAHAYDLEGRLVAQAPICGGRAQLAVSSELPVVRVFAGPVGEGERPMTLAQLRRFDAIERRIAPVASAVKLDIPVAKSLLDRWFPCLCFINGRVVVREELPDGSVRENPIVGARVTICEVDPVWTLVRSLPELQLFELKQHLLAQPLEPTIEQRIRPLAQPTQLRAELIEFARQYPSWPFWPLWPWWYRKSCFTTVTTDEQGRFASIYWYPCRGDKPDLYFKVEQQIGGVWTTIHEPPIRTGTHWNYACGSEVVIDVDHPAATAQIPRDPVIPSVAQPWVLPLAVGGMYIEGTAGAAPGYGWVQPNGFARYVNGPHGPVEAAPFALTLGIRLDHSAALPSAGMAYYRLSYRKGSSGNWAAMESAVTRHYARTVPNPGGAPLVSYPAVELGPVGVGSQANLFRFRPHAPPPPSSSDPVGTTHHWPVNMVASGDLYSGYFATASLGEPGITAGKWQIRLEIFDASGNLVAPGPAFAFIVPSNIDPDGTIHTRPAASSELIGGAFVFELEIDNNRCSASIDPPRIGTAQVNNCGFLEYPVSPPPSVELGFHATHPNNHARYSFSLVRATTTVVTTRGGPGATNDGFIDPSGNGHVSGTRPIDALRGPCPSAAFAAQLHVYALATNGWAPISGYDASAVRAFALTPAS
ncbi:MAG TPA: hypothetical protein VM869_19050 [Enhygromyxa sp.]|nr:hypothetical protein [Enhygromyxa sp.]